MKRQDPEVAKWVEVLKEKYAGLKLIVARDKLDYIKGVRQKMLAFERFLNLYPEYQGKVIIRLFTTEQILVDQSRTLFDSPVSGTQE